MPYVIWNKKLKRRTLDTLFSFEEDAKNWIDMTTWDRNYRKIFSQSPGKKDQRLIKLAQKRFKRLKVRKVFLKYVD